MQLDVLYRMIRGEVAAFLPDCEANFGNLMTYHHVGQHGEAGTEYYRLGRPAKPHEYAELHKELSSIYDDCKLVVRKRINWNKVSKMWQRANRPA